MVLDLTSKKIKLNEIAKFNQNNSKSSMDWDYISYLDTGNLTENKITNIQKIDLKNDKIPSRAKRIPYKNNILYSTVRPNKKHYGFIDNEVVPNLIVSTGFVVIEVDETKANPKYIYYYLTQNSVIDMLQSIGETSTSTYPSIKPSDLKNLELYLPSILDQIKIVNILSSLDDKIENNNAIIANLEEQAQAIFESWFVDFEPFQDGEFLDSELGKIPVGWEVKELGEFLPVRTGKKNANIAIEKGEYPFFTCSQDISYTDEFSFDAHAILLAGNGDFNVKRVNGKFEAYQRTYVLIPNNKELTGLFYYLINHYLDNIVSGYKGSVINLNNSYPYKNGPLL